MDDVIKHFYDEGFNAKEHEQNPYSYGTQIGIYCAWQAGFSDKYGNLFD